MCRNVPFRMCQRFALNLNMQGARGATTGAMQLAGVCMIGLELLLTVGVSFAKCILVVVLYFEKYSYLC